jgi:predicted dehydrogenase
VRLSLWATGERLPRAVTGRTLAQLGRADSPVPVPTDFSGELFFDDGLTAEFRCSFLEDFRQTAVLTGPNGRLELDDFVLPRAEPEIAFNVNGQRLAVAEHGSPHATAQETNLFRNFAEQIRHSPPLNTDWPACALKTQQVINALWESAQAESRTVPLG